MGWFGWDLEAHPVTPPAMGRLLLSHVAPTLSSLAFLLEVFLK